MTDPKDSDIRALLPWAANDTLSPEELIQVEQLLEDDSQAREELAQLRHMAAEIKADAPSGIVSELGWQRLKRQLEQPAGTAARPLKQARSGRVVAIAALLVITVQFGWMLALQSDKTDLQLELLVGPDQAFGDDSLVLQVMFESGARVGEINSLLAQLNARVIGGPTPLGLYRLSIPGVASKDIPEQIEYLSTQAIIRHVEQADVR